MPPATFNPDRITTLWLDLDDTLIDFRSNARASLHQMYADEPLLRSHFPDPQTWAETYERHNHELWDLYSKGEITRPYLRIERFRRPLTDGGIPEEEAVEAAKRYDTLYLDLLAQQRRMIPGAMQMLTDLNAIPSLKIGILSNGFKEVQYRKMDITGITPMVHLTVLSDDIGINKPDPRLFAHAMDRAGDTDPSHHLLVGDNPLTDIAGALRAGWNAVWYRHPDMPSTQPCPDGAVEINSLDQLIPLLGKGVIK